MMDGGAVPVQSSAVLPLVARLHVMVRVAEERFAFPVSDVEEALDAPSLSWAPGATKGVVGQLLCRGRNVTAYDAGWVLGVPCDGRTSGALVLRHGPARVAILVDDVEDLTMIEPQWVRRVPGGSELDGVLAGVYRARQRQGGLVGVVRVSALVAHVESRSAGAVRPA